MSMNKRIIFITSCFVFLLFVISSLFFIFNSAPKEATGPTGGSGALPVGSLVLYGYETPSNDDSAIPVGTFLSVDQQTTIESSLEEHLFKSSPQREYRGDIVAGTVEVDFLTSVVVFDVKIENPSITYTVRFNTITDEKSVTKKDETAS